MCACASSDEAPIKQTMRKGRDCAHWKLQDLQLPTKLELIVQRELRQERV